MVRQNMASLRGLCSRCFVSSNRLFRFISTSGGGKESSSPKAVPKEEPQDDFDAVEERRKKLPNPEGIKQASKTWLGQLPHEEDPTVGYDIWKSTYSLDGAEWYGGESVGANKFMNNLFPTDLIIKMHTKRDVSLAGYRRMMQGKDHKAEIKSQLFTPDRHGILGPDLATAHFICFRRGKVKFVGYDNWWFDHATLPKQYDPLYLIEKIDATGVCHVIFITAIFFNIFILFHRL